MDIITDYSRQVNIFDRQKWNTEGKPISIIGAGATGSWITLALAKMGIKNIRVYDFDDIGEHNIANQAFCVDKIGEQKVNALQSITKDMSGITIKTFDKEVTEKDKLNGIVFMLTDSMKSRREIFDNVIAKSPYIDLLIETRMDLRCGRIYAIKPSIIPMMEKYRESFYDDTEAEVSACGTSQTVISTAMGISAHAIWKFLNYVNKKEFMGETLIDFENNYIIENKWDEVGDVY